MDENEDIGRVGSAETGPTSLRSPELASDLGPAGNDPARMSMREKIARAIEAKLESIIVDAVANAGEGCGPYPSDYRDAADAVLEAMREPSEGMVEAGATIGSTPLPLTARTAWERMINAARNGA